MDLKMHKLSSIEICREKSNDVETKLPISSIVKSMPVSNKHSLLLLCNRRMHRGGIMHNFDLKFSKLFETVNF